MNKYKIYTYIIQFFISFNTLYKKKKELEEFILFFQFLNIF